MANTADVAAAAELGADRVVLAREMTLDEIAAASKVPGVKTEVFVQGALCFSVSGRCLFQAGPEAEAEIAAHAPAPAAYPGTLRKMWQAIIYASRAVSARKVLSTKNASPLFHLRRPARPFQ